MNNDRIVLLLFNIKFLMFEMEVSNIHMKAGCESLKQHFQVLLNEMSLNLPIFVKPLDSR